jgi:hypothetical protein
MSDTQSPARTFHFHADCIAAARTRNYNGICRTCYDDMAAALPRPASVTRGMQTVMDSIAVYKPDGSVDLGQCYA